MAAHRNEQYPFHLARLVSVGLAQRSIAPPREEILLRLFETLYFASLKTDEARQCRCTVNYMDPTLNSTGSPLGERENGWNVIPFHTPRKLDVRSLLKLADAADPSVSSLAVWCNADGELIVWGMVDQELRYGERVALDAVEDPQRPGLFQARIVGVGAISVYKNYELLGSLEQNHLISHYHDVLWEGPIHERLKENLADSLVSHLSEAAPSASGLLQQLQEELLVRCHNSVCRILYNIQNYGHGGGLLIVPSYPAPGLNVKYELTYDRLQRTLFQVSHNQIAKRQHQKLISSQCQTPGDMLRYQLHVETIQCQQKLDRLREELLGCNRFIASLSRVDGFVLLDKHLTVHGFGVEARPDDQLTDIYVAGDTTANLGLLRQVPLDQFGTRHRAMMRYCHQHEESLGFVISQDGDIRAIMKYKGRLIFWENINVQLAYRDETQNTMMTDSSWGSMSAMLQNWIHSQTDLRSA